MLATLPPDEPFWNITDFDDGYLFSIRLVIVVIGWTMVWILIRSFRDIRWRIVPLPIRIHGLFWATIWAGFGSFTWLANYSSEPQWYRATYGLSIVFVVISLLWMSVQAVTRKVRPQPGEFCPMHDLVIEAMEKMEASEFDSSVRDGEDGS